MASPPAPPDAQALARIRALGPRMRKASALWCAGDHPLFVAKALGPKITQALLAEIIAALNADPMTPPAWHFPPRPSDWATNAMARDAWVLGNAQLDNERFERRDFRSTMREHQRAHLGDAGRPMTAEQLAAQAEALRNAKDEPKPKSNQSIALMALMSADVADEEVAP